jgi:hypothetical protein
LRAEEIGLGGPIDLDDVQSVFELFISSVIFFSKDTMEKLTYQGEGEGAVVGYLHTLSLRPPP